MKSSKKGSTRQMMGITAMENDQVNTWGIWCITR